MIAINEAFKVDLSGLVCAKFIGPRFGDGFMHGAGYAKRGRSIVTIPSTTANGEESNIVMHIEPTLGIAMSTNRDDVHYVVTEYGIATLRGRSIRERALALIHIAHPKFRDELMKAAKAHRFVYADQLLALDAIYPDHVESQLTLKDDTRLLFRPAIPTDERMVQSFLYGMDARGIRYRFHGKLETVHHNRVQHFVNVDYTGTVTILGIREGDHGKEVIAIGQYLMYPEIEKAEVAFITAEDFRNRGIGTHLLKLLIGMAREKSIKAFFAEVLRQNHGMLKVFRKGGVPVEMTCEDGVHHVTLDLTADRDRRAKPAKQVPPQPSTGTDEKQESGGAEGRGTTLS
jgi:GNAT superfamily N-acetyltransferase